MPSLFKLIVTFSILLASCHASAQPADPGLICAEQIIRSDNLVKIDQQQKRIFVVKKNVKKTELVALIHELEPCFNDHEWKNQWSLSVFSSRKIAGYKDDPNIIPFHKKNEWAKGYLAEYSSLTRTLTLSPAINPREIEVQKSP